MHPCAALINLLYYLSMNLFLILKFFINQFLTLTQKNDRNNKNLCENHDNCSREQRAIIILLLFVNVNKARGPLFSSAYGRPKLENNILQEGLNIMFNC